LQYDFLDFFVGQVILVEVVRSYLDIDFIEDRDIGFGISFFVVCDMFVFNVH